MAEEPEEKIDHEEPGKRMRAVKKLSEQGEENIDLLEKTGLEDNEPFVRIGVAKGLGKIGTKEAEKVLEKMLEDENVNVQLKVAESLGKIGTEDVLDSLKDTKESVEGDIGREKVEKAIENIRERNKNP